MTELVHLSVSEAVATITLDSPANRNALSRQLIDELDERLAAAEADPSARVVVLAATGPVFCSGADLSEAADSPVSADSRISADSRASSPTGSTDRLLAILRRTVEMPKPVVGKVHAPVRAGGIGLIGACDIVIVSESATFAFPEVRLGLTPAIISLTTLPWMHPRAASRYFLTGEAFDGREAVQIGLATKCVPDVDLDAAVRTVVAALKAGSPQGLAESKRLVTRKVRTGLEQRGQEMADVSARLFGSAEAQERMRAALARRGK